MSPSPISDAPPVTSRRTLGVALGLLLLVLLGLFVILPRFRGGTSSASAPSSSRATATVEQKSFTQTLRLSGTTTAARSFSATAPQLEGAESNTLNILSLVSAGAEVHQGDIVVQFDPQSQVKDFLDKQKTYTDLVSQVEQKKSEKDIARAKDDTEIAQAENAFKKAELDVQRNEIVSRIDAEKNQEALDEARATLEQLKETYALKRKADAADIRIVEIQRDNAREAMRYSQSNTEKMTIRSPMNGVAVLNSIWLGSRMGTAQKGDSVQPGVAFVDVVDPSQMEVLATVSQADIARLKPGQSATLHLDAYPAIALQATLEELSPVAQQGRFSESVRMFSVRFVVKGSDPHLLPDLSASLDIPLASVDNALVAPRQAVVRAADGDFVWVKSGVSFEKRAVKLGALSDTEAVIVSGVSKGDELRLQPAAPDSNSPAKGGS